MSGTTATSPAPPIEATRQVPMARLARVELRKLFDTRSGRWLLISIVLLTAGVLTIMFFAAPPEELTYENFVSASTAPQGILLPILGILTVTSEWGQRTGLVTFTLEPERSRIVVAKIIAVVVMGIAAVAIALALAAGLNVLAEVTRSGAGDWSFDLVDVRNLLLLQLIGVIQGLALGMLIMNAAGAIVTAFAIPIVWGILTSTVKWFRDIGDWVDLNVNTGRLMDNDLGGGGWARLGVSVAIWVGLPLLLGWIRLVRRELKSA